MFPTLSTERSLPVPPAVPVEVLHIALSDQGSCRDPRHAIDDLGLAWIEEPIVYDNLEGYARLTADLKTPVQIGENFYGPRALYTALQMKACDYVMPDFMRIGGVTGWQRPLPLHDARRLRPASPFCTCASCAANCMGG